MVDLHMHTVYSDGDKTVKEILEMCEKKKLEYISITDHNTCEAYLDEDLENNDIYSGTIIKGCELNAEFKNRAIEILGYNINPEIIMSWRENYYSKEKMKENSDKIYNRFLEILDKKGIVYNRGDIRPQKNETEYVEKTIWEEIIKHPENKEIIGKEYFNCIRPFYRKEVTNPNSDYFLNRVGTFPKAKEIVQIIHKAGGKAFFAHPFEYKFENTLEFVQDLIKVANIDGIECFHPSVENSEKIDLLIECARKNNLYISGGSDYHGSPKPEIEVGIGTGTLSIPRELIEEWI